MGNECIDKKKGENPHSCSIYTKDAIMFTTLLCRPLNFYHDCSVLDPLLSLCRNGSRPRQEANGREGWWACDRNSQHKKWGHSNLQRVRVHVVDKYRIPK